MQIVVELNTEKEILWGFPGSTPILSLSQPAVMIDVEKLNEAQKRCLALGLQAKKLKSTTAWTDIPLQPIEIPKPASGSVSQLKPSVAEYVAAEAQKFQERVEATLSKSVLDVKKEVLASKDYKFVKGLYVVETIGKKRAGLLKFLNTQMSELEIELQKSMAITDPKAAEVHDPARIEIAGEVVDYEVVDTEMTEITLELPERGK